MAPSKLPCFNHWASHTALLLDLFERARHCCNTSTCPHLSLLHLEGAPPRRTLAGPAGKKSHTTCRNTEQCALIAALFQLQGAPPRRTLAGPAASRDPEQARPLSASGGCTLKLIHLAIELDSFSGNKRKNRSGRLKFSAEDAR